MSYTKQETKETKTKLELAWDRFYNEVLKEEDYSEEILHTIKTSFYAGSAETILLIRKGSSAEEVMEDILSYTIKEVFN